MVKLLFCSCFMLVRRGWDKLTGRDKKNNNQQEMRAAA